MGFLVLDKVQLGFERLATNSTDMKYFLVSLVRLVDVSSQDLRLLKYFSTQWTRDLFSLMYAFDVRLQITKPAEGLLAIRTAKYFLSKVSLFVAF